ncbi:hypothetical protein ACIFOC_02251 [Leucobacter aridicollis]|uniref:aminoglycoside 3'-phosphotransferase n=1 Tax=Leucobacter aridicollis TaxID=283878 RepID=UPI0037C99760
MYDAPEPVAEIPTGPVAVPDPVRDLTGGRHLVPVWVNELGGLTFRDEGAPGDGERYVKWVPAGTPELDLAAEATRLTWARAHGATVPEVLSHGSIEDGDWLITRALAGASAVEPQWIAEPATAALAIGAGLRRLHDTLPVAECPFEWGIAGRIERFEERVASGASPGDWHRGYRDLTVDSVRRRLHEAPDPDRLVVCHGDACAPNTLLDPAGRFAAHVDLGSLGVADRWADLAVAAWSIDWNHGPGFDHLVYEGYGIAPDQDRIAYYRLLWDVG